jgi:phenylalanyl-tRNA synthetase alpha chain
MSRSPISARDLASALSLTDLTDPASGPHAMQILVEAIVRSLQDAWQCPTILERAHPIVRIEDNYDRLHYPPDGAARDARYTRYVSDSTLLRTQTSAMIPPLLERTSKAMPPDVLLVCPGLVYRRDSIDRLHTGEPHQLDLWRIRADVRLEPSDLEEMIGRVVSASLPRRSHRTLPAQHPYTLEGRQIEVESGPAWVEIGECGLALPALLAEGGLDPSRWSGLAMGLGLDRLLMLNKGIDDIRTLRATDPRIRQQMLDLSPYRPVSTQPPIRRDLSIAVDEETTAEEIGDRVRAKLGDRACHIETVEVLSSTPMAALPKAAIARLGMKPGQKNVLLRIVIRDLSRTLTDEEANILRDEIYGELHQGAVWQWAARPD